jgi:hypothetical protein
VTGADVIEESGMMKDKDLLLPERSVVPEK